MPPGRPLEHSRRPASNMTPQVFGGWLYGMQLRSAVPLPGLSPCTAPRPEREIAIEFVDRRPQRRTGAPHFTFGQRRDPEHLELRIAADRSVEFWFGDGTWARLSREATRIELFTPNTSTFDDTLSYLYGVLVGFAMRARGILALHASSVVLRDAAVAFVGPSGAGKSTLAAAFAQHGYSVLSEDVVGLTIGVDGVTVHRGHANVRLWPNAAEMLRTPPLAEATRAWPKLVLPTAVPESDSMLSGIYLLQERSSERSVSEPAPLAAAAALLELLPHSYASRLLRAEDRPEELRALGAMMQVVPVRRLVVPSLPDGFDSLVDALLSDRVAPARAGAPSTDRRRAPSSLV
jgi:hypothetical protein